MTEPTKIEFRWRKIHDTEDFTDITDMLFPGNANQRYAAACILFELKWADDLVPNFTGMESQYGLSRRTVQRTRAKLSRLGMIEHVSGLSLRSGGRSGWKLSGRFSCALQQLAEKVDHWREARDPNRQAKDQVLREVAKPAGRRFTEHCSDEISS